MSSDSPVKFKEARLHSATGNDDYDIRVGVSALDYYEDLLKPGTTISITYVDTGDSRGRSVFDASFPLGSRC
jgi:hypothetical protein